VDYLISVDTIGNSNILLNTVINLKSRKRDGCIRLQKLHKRVKKAKVSSKRYEAADGMSKSPRKRQNLVLEKTSQRKGHLIATIESSNSIDANPTKTIPIEVYPRERMSHKRGTIA